MLIKSNGIENITKIHLKDSVPPRNIIKEGCTTRRIAKIILKFFEDSILELFIDALAKIYDDES